MKQMQLLVAKMTGHRHDAEQSNPNEDRETRWPICQQCQSDQEHDARIKQRVSLRRGARGQQAQRKIEE